MTDEQLHKKFVHNISKHQGILHKICNLYAHTATDRQDLLQEMLLQLWRAYPNFRGQAKISTWMYRIALNTAISSFRKQKRQIKTQNFQSDDVFLNKFIDTISIEEDEKLAQMYAAIAKLKDLEKAIVMLYLEDYSYEKIADMLGISSNHIGVKLHRIKLKLKKMVQKK
ncbi:MAG: RNA polymerase sigma factor [Chitinophagales bacterium]